MSNLFWNGVFSLMPTKSPTDEDQTDAYRAACRDDIAEVYDSLRQREVAYVAASTEAEFSRALRSARIVQQYEDMVSNRTAGARDLYMAENSVWLLEEAGPDAKIVLWAHNGHIADNPYYGNAPSLGHHLRSEYAGDLVIVGFDFHQGSFRAVSRNAAGAYGGLTEHTVGAAPTGSYEWYFHSAGFDRLILDVRDVDLETSATSWLAGPRKMRSIGSVFTPTDPSAYLYHVSIPERYDLIIFFEHTTGAVGLPFQYPSGW